MFTVHLLPGLQNILPLASLFLTFASMQVTFCLKINSLVILLVLLGMGNINFGLTPFNI